MKYVRLCMKYIQLNLNRVRSFNERIIFDEGKKILFVENPKCGSTSIRRSLLGTSHVCAGSNFKMRALSRKNNSLSSRNILSAISILVKARFKIFGWVVVMVIRPPQQRIISAYQDKIKNYSSVESIESKYVFDAHRSKYAYYLSKHGLDDNVESFIEWIVSESIYNVHWNPQHNNIVARLLRPSVYLELEDLNSFLEMNNYNPKEVNVGQNSVEKASVKLENLSSKALDWMLEQEDWFRKVLGR